MVSSLMVPSLLGPTGDKAKTLDTKPQVVVQHLEPLDGPTSTQSTICMYPFAISRELGKSFYRRLELKMALELLNLRPLITCHLSWTTLVQLQGPN